MILSVASQKGGVGKTSTSVSIAAGLARKGKKVLLVDIDSQANSSKVLLPNYQELQKEHTLYRTILDRQPLVIHQTTIDNLHIAPSHILLSETDIELGPAMDHREERLKRELDKIKNQFDEVIIDCPPSLGWLCINAFTASDKVLIIVSPGYFELDSIVAINRTLKKVQEFFNPSLQLAGYLFTMSAPTLNSKTSLSILRQTYTTQVLNTVVPRNTDLADASFNQKDVFSYSPQAPASYAYLKLINELYQL